MVQKRDSKFYEDLVQKEATRLSNELIPQISDEDEYEEDYTDITEENKQKKDKKRRRKNWYRCHSYKAEPEISAKDAIEKMELFKELLGEASKEDIKKARIQDASDYLLKFFAGTKEADVGSAAAEVAEFAVSKDSRTDRAKEALRKQIKQQQH